MVRYDARNARWAADLIAEAGRLLEAGEDARAFRLLRQAEPYIQGHPELLQARDALLLPIAVRPDPPGADVYVKPYADGDGPWERLGRTPLETRGPLGFFRWRVTRAGFTPFEGAAPASMGEMKIVLMPDGAVPSGMVPIPEGTALAGSGESIRLAPFYLDRFEVTTASSSGSRTRAAIESRSTGRSRSSRTAASCRSTTPCPNSGTRREGRAVDVGPGTVPGRAGRLSGARRELVRSRRVLALRRQAAPDGASLAARGQCGWQLLERPRVQQPLGKRAGAGRQLSRHRPFGTYDMAGNVKEWCWNEVRSKRYILGGAWNEPNYQFRDADARSPFERVARNGFRTMRLTDPSALAAAAMAPVARLERDYSEKPVPAEVFRTYESFYSFDRTPLKPATESTDDSSPFWRRERVTYAAAYGDERIVAYLFLPKRATPPYQTVI